jgi:predicted RNA-binding Zn-ribbon protein involved in translation (DUF1610 family)
MTPSNIKALTTIIYNRPMKHSLPPKCPFCDSEKVYEKEHMCTLVGGDPDPNHHWRTFECSCGKKFIYQHKYDYGWITDENNLCVEGIHACFESVEYKCQKCGGTIKREHRNIDGKNLLAGGQYGPILQTNFDENGAHRQYRTFWKCNKCGSEVETEE